MRSIDLNADLGEGYGPWAMGDDAAMFAIVSSANIACGGHASDPETMFRTLTMARDKGINVGAHPSYPDKESFGRRRLPFAPAEIERFVAAQIGALAAIGGLVGKKIAYVKPHGALGNAATEDGPIAHAILRAVRAVDPALSILAISGTMLEKIAGDAGTKVFSEVYADRGYTDGGNLVPRGQPGDLIHDPETAARRMLGFIETGRMPTVDGRDVELNAHSICIHGDSPESVTMAIHLRDALLSKNVRTLAFIAPV